MNREHIYSTQEYYMLSIDLKLISWNDVDSLTVLRLEGYILQLIYLILGLLMNEQIYEH